MAQFIPDRYFQGPFDVFEDQRRNKPILAMGGGFSPELEQVIRGLNMNTVYSSDRNHCNGTCITSLKVCVSLRCSLAHLTQDFVGHRICSRLQLLLL